MTAKTCGACQPSSVSSRCWHDRRCSVLRLMANSTRHLPSESRFLFLLSFAWNYARSPFGSHNRESEKRISFGLALLNGYLAELAQTIYNDWFRDFGHWGGQMPSHWETGVLGDYVTVKRGGSPRPIQEYLSDEGLRWLKIADVSGISGPYILEIKEHIKEEGLRKTVHLEPGSLVLSNSATPGIPKILSIDTCIHDGWLYFPQSQFTNEWLYCYFLNVRQELVRMANGSVFQNLKTDIVKNFEVIRPDDETLASFQEMVAPLFNLMESCQKENKQLADLRDTLLPKLMSGEIDVSKVDLTQLNSHLA